MYLSPIATMSIPSSLLEPYVIVWMISPVDLMWWHGTDTWCQNDILKFAGRTDREKTHRLT